jgi:hypothetical protein
MELEMQYFEQQKQEQAGDLTQFKKSMATQLTSKLDEYRVGTEAERKNMTSMVARELAKVKASCCWKLFSSSTWCITIQANKDNQIVALMQKYCNGNESAGRLKHPSAVDLSNQPSSQPSTSNPAPHARKLPSTAQPWQSTLVATCIRQSIKAAKKKHGGIAGMTVLELDVVRICVWLKMWELISLHQGWG